MVHFALNAVGALKSNVGMGGYPLVSEKPCTSFITFVFKKFTDL